MNKANIAKLRERNRAKAEPLQAAIGAVERVKVCNFHLNRNRRAAFAIEFLCDDGRKLRLFASSTIRARCISELREGCRIQAELQTLFRHDKYEYELINFRGIK